MSPASGHTKAWKTVPQPRSGQDDSSRNRRFMYQSYVDLFHDAEPETGA